MNFQIKSRFDMSVLWDGDAPTLRGAALYVSNEPLTDSNYSSGVCCSI